MLHFILLGVVAFSLNSVCTRFFQLRFSDPKRNISLYQAMFCLFAAILFFAFGDPGELPKADTVICGVLFGIFFFGAILASAIGFETGSMALTSVITNMSLLLPVLYSLLVLKESIDALHILGILLFLATFLLSSGMAGKEPIRLVWLSVVFAAFLSNGLTAVIQKHYILHAEQAQGLLLMCLAYLTAALLFFGEFLLLRRRIPATAPFSCKRLGQMTGLAMLSGIGSFGGNLLLTYLSDKVSGAVLYPCVNGGLCLLLTVISCCFFREKLNLRKLLALLCGGLAIVVLNLA